MHMHMLMLDEVISFEIGRRLVGQFLVERRWSECVGVGGWERGCNVRTKH